MRIEQHRYLELKAYLAELAVHRRRDHLEEELRRLPFEPYAPVRGQLHCLLREVNRRREIARFEPVSTSAIRTRRRVVRPFEKRVVEGAAELFEPLAPEQSLQVPRAVNDA